MNIFPDKAKHALISYFKKGEEKGRRKKGVKEGKSREKGPGWCGSID